LRDPPREPSAPFQKFIMTSVPPSRRRPVFRARPKTENRAAGKIVYGLNVNHSVKNHVADYFQPKSKQKNLAPRCCI
jgi:hypothetical protein